ncbi:MAG: NADH-quinone oxidoreductase subunit H [Candidatus Micrarchaeota archaeon]|nr:NADH-quinone oxidoreductase subunit H [Candidatus Micrarchaeota archaeon]
MTIDLSSIAMAILQILFIFGFSPLLIGIMRKVKARLQGRIGSPIIQPYIDVLKLLSKGTVKSSISSFIFTIAPVLGFVSIAIAALALPIISSSPFLVVSIIIFAYLFSIGRFMTALSGLDAGSAFGGLGSSREMLYSVLIEPALFAVILFLVASGSSSITPIAGNSWDTFAMSPVHWFAALALFIIILAETGRLPFDNPATHLELTMVHEAMILENSGPNLALIEWGHASKIFLLFSLLAIIFLPAFPQDSLLRPAFILGISIILAIVTAVVESISVKVRLFKVGELMLLAMLLAGLSLLTKIFGSGLRQEDFAITLLVFLMLLSSLYFIFSATFKRRLEIYIFQSICLVLIFIQPVLLGAGGTEDYFRIITTVIFKLIVIPLIFYHLFRTLPGEVKLLPIRFYKVFKESKDELKFNLDFDPLFTIAPISTTRGLIYAGVLVLLAFILSSFFGVTTLVLPFVLSLILIGMLIIAVKTHLLLQLFGFLLMENGVTLLPYALSIKIPIISDMVALLDVVLLIILAVLLTLKIQVKLGTLDTKELDELIEKR